MMPPMTSEKATIISDRAPLEIWWRKAKPKMTTGTVPSAMYQPMMLSGERRTCLSVSPRTHALVMRPISLRK